MNADLIGKIIGAHADSIEANRHIRASIRYSNWVKEFASIKLDLPRQSGKTHWITHNARSNDLVVLHNTYSVIDMVENLRARSLTPNEMPYILTPLNVANAFIGKRRGHLNRVIFDEPSLFAAGGARVGDIIALLNACGVTYEQVIQLGTSPHF